MQNKAYKSAERGVASSSLLAAVAAVVVIGGGAYAYKAGYLFNKAGKKAEEELKAQIESLKGEGIKNKVIALAKNSQFNQYFSPEDIAKRDAELDKLLAETSISLDYTNLVTSNADNKAKAEASDVKITVKSESIDGYAISPKMTVYRAVDDKNHYFFDSAGSTDFFTNKSGTPVKLGSVSSASSTGEIKLNDVGDIVYTKSESKDIKLIEGNGGTTVLSIAEVFTETSNKIENDLIDSFAKASYKGIAPGDMAKMFVGNIEPLSISYDYSYKGDNFISQFSKLISEKEKALKAQAVPAEQAATPDAAAPVTSETAVTPAPEIKSFNGDMKLGDLSILTGDAGFVINGAVNFKKENPTPIPFGEVTFKVAQYQKLLALVNRFIPQPQDKIDTYLQFFGEIGEVANNNITVKVTLDGTENVKIGGKTQDELLQIYAKYAQKLSGAPQQPVGIDSDPVDPSSNDAQGGLNIAPSAIKGPATGAVQQ